MRSEPRSYFVLTTPSGAAIDEEMIEKHYGDARVDADQLVELLGELENSTRNLSGTLPEARGDTLPSKVKEPLAFYCVPTRAGDRGRTGDVQLGKLIEDGREDHDPWG